MNDMQAPVHPRPWVEHYPPGIKWDVEIDLTPVHEQVLASCRKRGDADALDFLGRKTSFSALAKAIETMAGAFQQRLGIKKGTRVALLMPNTPYYVIAYYAVLRAGGTIVNCNPLYSVAELTHIVSNARAETLITLDLKLTFDKAEALCRAGHVKTVVVCNFPDVLPRLKGLLYRLAKSSDLARPRLSPVADRLVYWSDLRRMGARPTPVAIDTLRDVAVQQYTGGTTGLPKGAMLSHANVAANLDQIDKWGGDVFNPPSKVLAVLPFFHIFAMTTCLNIPLARGVEIVMLPRFDLKGFIDAVTRTRPNFLPAVPTLLHAVATSRSVTAETIGSIDFAVSGGAPLSAETRAAFGKLSDAVLAEGYGLTEASPVVVCAPLKAPSKPNSIGQPIPATDIRLVDVDTGQPVPIGERGELQVKGPQVMLGYFDDEGADKSAFMDGWLRTGDVAILDEDGFVFLVDRIKDMIICSGFNVYPRNIEDALLHHPAVDEVSVIGVPDDYRGEAPVAYVKLVEGQSATASELKDFLADRISKIEMPREIFFKDQLPKTLIGKLSKKELREEYKASKARKKQEPKSEQA